MYGVLYTIHMSSEDSDVLDDGSASITTMLIDLSSKIQFKLFALMFVIFILISSDTFVNRILSRASGAVDQRHPTNWGTMLQGMFLVLVCIMLDVAIKQKII